MIEKRYYQQEAKDAIIHEWESGNKKTLLVLPTGCGKTIVFTDTLGSVIKDNKKGLVLAHTGELLDQAMDKIEKYSDLNTALEKAEKTAVESDKPVVVASVQTLCRDNRLIQYPPDFFSYIVVDEAHHCMSDSYQKILNYFSEANVLGVTATPNRGDHKELASFFDSKAYEYEFRTAIKDGFLCPIKTETIPLCIDISGVKMQSGDFAAGEVGETLESYLYSIAKNIQEKCENRKTVVFLPLISTAQNFCSILNKIGVPAAEINGKSADRDTILEDFKNGKYKVLCNAMLLTEGWDCPEVDCIVVLRPTKSDALYRQMVGRGCRIAPGKENLLLLDFLWMSKRHDLMHPADLIGKNDEITHRMTKACARGGEHDLFEIEEDAIRDYEAEIEERLRRELEISALISKEEKRLNEAIAALLPFGKMFKDDDLMLYEHCYPWEENKITSPQANTLINMGIDKKVVYVLTKGAASALLSTLFARRKHNLCSYKQARLLNKYGVDASALSFSSASIVIDKIMKSKSKK